MTDCQRLLGQDLLIEPEDGGCQSDGEKEGGRTSIIAYGDPAPVLQTPEHDLDPGTASVSALGAFDWPEPRFSAGDAELLVCVFSGRSLICTT